MIEVATFFIARSTRNNYIWDVFNIIYEVYNSFGEDSNIGPSLL